MFATATKEDIKSDVKTGASRVGNDIRQTASNIRKDLNQANVQGNLEDAANEIGQKVHDYLDSASSELSDASNRITAEIRTSPVKYVAYAGVIGFLLGLAMRR